MQVLDRPPVVAQNSIKARRLQYEVMLDRVPPTILRKRIAKMLAYNAACYEQTDDEPLKEDLLKCANYLLYGIET